MTEDFENSWGNATRAEAYSKLEFPNTYHLAYRDLPEIIDKHVTGKKAIDFGCGAGRSTRFLKKLGFEVIGLDISRDMLVQARKFDLYGDYQLVENGKYLHLGIGKFDLVQAIFTFDNIPGKENRVNILKELAMLLKPNGKLILLDANSEMYTNEWASFSTKFPENMNARSGDIVCTMMKDVEDARPIQDILWTEEDYLEQFQLAGLKVEAIYRPLGRPDEPFDWVVEETIHPWVIFVLRNK